MISAMTCDVGETREEGETAMSVERRTGALGSAEDVLYAVASFLSFSKGTLTFLSSLLSSLLMTIDSKTREKREDERRESSPKSILDSIVLQVSKSFTPRCILRSCARSVASHRIATSSDCVLRSGSSESQS